MEEQLKYNVLYRWFWGLSLESKTPDPTYLCRVRKSLGADRIGEMFAQITDEAMDRKILRKLGRS